MFMGMKSQKYTGCTSKVVVSAAGQVPLGPYGTIRARSARGAYLDSVGDEKMNDETSRSNSIFKNKRKLQLT